MGFRSRYVGEEQEMLDVKTFKMPAFAKVLKNSTGALDRHGNTYKVGATVLVTGAIPIDPVIGINDQYFLVKSVGKNVRYTSGKDEICHPDSQCLRDYDLEPIISKEAVKEKMDPFYVKDYYKW